MLQGFDVLNGDFEAPGEGYVSVRMARRHANSSGEVLGGLPGYISPAAIWAMRMHQPDGRERRQRVRMIYEDEGSVEVFATQRTFREFSVEPLRPPRADGLKFSVEIDIPR